MTKINYEYNCTTFVGASMVHAASAVRWSGDTPTPPALVYLACNLLVQGTSYMALHASSIHTKPTKLGFRNPIAISAMLS